MGFKAERFSNPADVFMKVLSLNYPKLEEDEQKVNKLLENYEQKQLK